MAVQVICVQMNGNDDLIFVSPHSPRGLFADFERYVRCDLTGDEALIAVPRDDISATAEALLHGDHFSICVSLGAVDGVNVYLSVGLIVAFNVPDRVV